MSDKTIIIRILKENLANMDEEEFEILDHNHNSLCFLKRFEMIDEMPYFIYDKYSEAEISFLVEKNGKRPSCVAISLTSSQYKMLEEAIDIYKYFDETEYDEVFCKNKSIEDNWVDSFLKKISSEENRIKYFKDKYNPNSDYWKV